MVVFVDEEPPTIVSASSSSESITFRNSLRTRSGFDYEISEDRERKLKSIAELPGIFLTVRSGRENEKEIVEVRKWNPFATSFIFSHIV